MRHSGTNQLTRRSLLGNIGLGIAAVTFSSAKLGTQAFAATEEITLLSWETYSDAPWLEEWSVKSGVNVNAVFGGSVDEFFARISSGAVQPDIIYLDSSLLPRLYGMGLLSPIDASKVANVGNISPVISYKELNTIDGNLYGLPYSWGPIPMIYNADRVVEGRDSWMTLLDPKYTGRVSVADDTFNSLPIIAMMGGAANPYRLTEDEFGKVTEVLKKLRPQVKVMTTGLADTQALYAGDECDVGISMTTTIITNLQAAGKNISYSIPKEGAPAYLDNAILTKKGDRPEVYDFLNAQLSFPWQKRFVENYLVGGVFDPKSAAAAGIDAKVSAKTVIPLLEDPAEWKRLAFFQEVEDVDRRLQLWSDFKAGVL